MSGAWGSGTWGSGAWGGAAGADITALAAIALRENVVRIEFSKLVYLTGLLETSDASRPDKWAMTPDTSTRGLDDSVARPVRVVEAAYSTEADGVAVGDLGRFVNLTLDRPMTAWPAVYTLQFFDVYAEDLASSVTGELALEGAYRLIEQPTIEQARPVRDFALVKTVEDVGLDFDFGTYQVADDGDYAWDEGVASLRKRVVRRLITMRGAFAHLPGYGVGIPAYVKQLAISSTLTQLAADAEAQIAREPDVAKVTVAARVDPSVPNLVRFLVRVKRTVGPSVQFDVPFRQAP